MADPLAIYGAITGSIGTIASLYLLRRRVQQEQSRFTIKIEQEESKLKGFGYIVVIMRVLIANRSRVDNSVCQIMLEAREDNKLAFSSIEPLISADFELALARYSDDANMAEICSKDDALILPLNIAARTSKDGWLAFVVEPNQAHKAVHYHWYVKLIDQDGKSYTSPSAQDLTLIEK